MDPIAASNPAANGGQLDLHVPGRRLDLAFAALRDIRSGSYVRCLHPMGLTVAAPAALVESLPDVYWVVSDTHPLAFVEPSFHHRLHQGWLEAAEGPDRLGRARILTCEPIVTTTDAIAPVGWYEVQLVDLVGVDGFEVMVVSLIRCEPDPHWPEDAVEDSSGPPGWLQNTGTFRLQLDRSGHIEGASINAAEILSRTIPDLIGLIATDLIHPDDRELAREAWRLVLATANRSEPARLRVLTTDDRWRWFDVTSWNQLDDPSIAAVMCEARDVDDQVRAELAREASERAHGRLAQVLDEVDDLVMVARLGYGLVYWNRAAKAAFPGFEIGTKLIDLIDPTLGGQVEAEVVPAIQRLEGWKGDLTVTLPDGELHVMAATISPVLDPAHDEIYFGITLREVTVERDHARALADQARRDPLTGLPNRFALMELLERHRRNSASANTTDARDEAEASHRTITVLFV
ncbi:MAG: PAS domain-containing protein, partial [Aquihabitans sp.]